MGDMASKSRSSATVRAKTQNDENFPVASFVLGRELRRPVLAFYRFVRQADDIADSPSLLPEEKLDRLDRLERALLAADPAQAAGAGPAAGGVGVSHASAQA